MAVQRQARRRPGRLALSDPRDPDIAFTIGKNGFPVAADWTVVDAEPGKPPIPQRATFAGRLDGNGLRWPRRIAIAQRGRPYFTLDIAAFRAG